ncbi:MAG TPA: DMT family transporter [Candidatus Saccharimonadales bacterium]|nr:DMT family transporter [Candidatus Saccharimonadales bacterium]
MTLFIVVLISVAAAFCNGLSAVLQRVAAAREAPPQLFRRRFIVNLFQSKLWLIGAGFDILGFLLQALALAFGALIVVEPSMTTDLIFIMVVLLLGYKVPVGKREWWSAAAICVGLGGLLVVAQPRGGHLEFDVVKWVILSAVVALLIGLTIFVARRMPYGHARAAFTGLATAANFALSAGLTKLAVDILKTDGIPAVLTSWELYGMIASMVISIVMIQNTYGAGSLVVSEPTLAITKPLFGVIIGMVMFGDSVSTTPLSLALASIFVIILGAGVVILSGSRRIIDSKL